MYRIQCGWYYLRQGISESFSKMVRSVYLLFSSIKTCCVLSACLHSLRRKPSTKVPDSLIGLVTTVIINTRYFERSTIIMGSEISLIRGRQFRITLP